MLYCAFMCFYLKKKIMFILLQLVTLDTVSVHLKPAESISKQTVRMIYVKDLSLNLFSLFFFFADCPLLLPALRLFIPPLRLVSAAMWQVVQRGNVQDYGMVEEFVSTVSEIVPELLNADQKAQLLLGLRARVGVRSDPSGV